MADSVRAEGETVHDNLRVLVAEDDASMAAGIVRGLRAEGMSVELATNGMDGLRLARTGSFDIVVLDLMLPEQSGFDVLKHLSSRRTTPVIVLSARTELEDRLKSFELGAVDFVAKPFWMAELVARIRTALRVRVEAPKRVVRWADVEVDLDGRSVRVGGEPVALTLTELDVLAYLMERPDRAISRGQLAESALDPVAERDARTVDSHVARLRRKLGAAGGAAIVTVWGIGYRFEATRGR